MQSNKSIVQAPCLYCGTLTSRISSYCCGACEILAGSVALPAVTTTNPYDYLDNESFKQLYRLEESSAFDYVFYAEGIHCSSCVHLLEKLPVFCDQITHSQVNFGKSTVSVKLKKGGSLSSVAQTIENLGYKPKILNLNENNADKSQKKESRSYLMKIAVAGFCAGNIMLFVIPVYSGLTGLTEKTFNWISFFLFLPILFYSAIPFYKGALNSLKFQVVNVDLPIVVAMLTGFLFSFVNLVRGDGNIYFDSTASFLFFILSARFLLKKTQVSYLSINQAQSFFRGTDYLKSSQENGREQFISTPWQSLKTGDIVKIRRGQTIPAEAELISDVASVDMSLFNGESLPKDFTRGMTLFAGTKILSVDILIKISKNFNESKLGHLFRQLEESALGKNSFTQITDKISQKLIVTVFSVAIVFFLFYFQIDASEAFNRSLALIVLACPCALAFGTPLTYGLAVRTGQRFGILIKNSSALDKLLNVKNIFFDKTGTLTCGALSLSQTQPKEISDNLKKIILSLESRSYHPIAFALRKAWSSTALCPIENFEEQLGQGVRGQIGSDSYEIRNLSESIHESELGIEIQKNGESVARLYFTDEIRSDSAEIVRSLQKEDYNCFVISGDKKSRTLSIAKVCSIPETHVYAELFPEDKKSIIESHRPCCVIGDGANDAPSLQAADIGIAVHGSVDISLSHSDVYFTQSGLSSLSRLIWLSKKTRTVLIRNLSLSLAYNFIGGALALAGFINPLMAAILMPISSALIILSTVWGFR